MDCGEKEKHILVCIKCGAVFTALSGRARYCVSCRKIIGGITMSNNRKAAANKGGPGRGDRKAEPAMPPVLAKCPSCGAMHKVAGKRAEPGKTPRIYCAMCVYKRGWYEPTAAVRM
jgi:hypothetical protein